MEPINQPFDIGRHPIHLGLGATSVPQPEHTGEMEWYMDYGARHGDDGNEGRLLSMHTFTESWDTWEMHPNGSEVVFVVDGTATFIQEIDGAHRRVVLTAGQAIINDPGVWHTAEMAEGETARVVFVTAGVGTEVRPV